MLNASEKSLTISIAQYVDKNFIYPEVWRTFRCDQIFIGVEKYDSLEYEEFSYGNAILFNLPEAPDQYVYVGSQIVQFSTSSPIREFISTVGNSDVPYSYAEDSCGAYYFFQGSSLVDKLNSIPDEVKSTPGKVYEHFYNQPHSNVTQIAAIILQNSL